MSIGDMPTEELEQALLEAKWSSAEADVPEVIARLLDLPREAIIRVQYAFHAAQNARLGAVYLGEDEIPDEVQTALKAQIRRGLLRVCVRDAIRDDKPMYAHAKSLIKKASGICRGCSFSIDCVTKSYSTPEKCFKSGPPASIRQDDQGFVQLMRFSHGGALVHPQRIRGDLVTVACTHPLGTYDVDVGQLWP